MLALQFDQVVRREIDDQHRPARLHHARGFAQRGGRIVGVVQHMMDGDHVEAAGLEGQRIHVTLADVGVFDAGAREVGARERQHLAALVDADRLFDLGRQHLEQPAGAGADVEQAAGAQRQVMDERAFDLAVGHVQRAQLVPALGIVAEEPRGGGLAALLQGVEPGAIGGEAGMLGIEPAHEFAHQGRVVARGNQAEAGELGLPETLQKACFHQQFQVARHPGLALSQHVDVVAHRQVFAGGEGQNAQPCVFGSGPQEGQQMIHAERNISISLYLQVWSRRNN